MSEVQELDEQSDTEGTVTGKRLTIPSPNPATNLLIADIVLRGASVLFHKSV